MTAWHRGDDWTLRAKCRGMEDALFPEASDQKRAKLVCSGCPVRLECLSEALDHRIEWGVWGGMTERERRLYCASAPTWCRGAQSLSASRTPTRRSASRSVTSPANVATSVLGTLGRVEENRSS